MWVQGTGAPNAPIAGALVDDYDVVLIGVGDMYWWRCVLDR